MIPAPLLDVKDLTIEFKTRNGTVTAVRHVDLSVSKGETVGIVGESGSGKSVTSYAVMRILDRAGRIAEGSVRFDGIDIAAAPERAMAELRGREMSMIFQNPRMALNPIRPIGRQIADVLVEHVAATRANAREKAIELLKLVKIADPERRYDAYPFELSGGMCQRVVIAIALACKPKLLIADEPTTGLDVTTQKTIMDLVMDLTRERGMSTILITHDLGLASAYCDRVVVMEKGLVVEDSTAGNVFASPSHPYTKRLMRATPRPGATLRQLLPEEIATAPVPEAAPAPTAAPLLKVADLVKSFDGPAVRRMPWQRKVEAAKPARAVDSVGFEVGYGECVGLVGESGCGKSTTSAMVMRLLDPTSGSIVFDGTDVGAIPARDFARHPLRSALQMVFQDPTDSLNPRFTAFRCIVDPLYRLGGVKNAAEARARVERLADQVGLPRSLLDRFPHQMSGGQKARVGIARAIALDPKLLVLDEPTAALDVSVQAVVLNLLADLKAQLGMSYLFVSHDLHVVRLLCDRVIVMRSGRIVEQGTAEQVMEAPQNDYTKSLLEAVPHPPAMAVA
ncbi:MAG: dipeptide ABC transporter ATP-binding protein [Alphaproteobacteria bacterium]